MAKVMPVYVEEALNGSSELSLEARGIYWPLLFKLWSCDGLLKDDEKMICRVFSISTRKWRRLRLDLIERGKLTVRDGYLSNDKLEVTLKLMQNKSQTSSKLSKKRWAKSLKNNNVDTKLAYAIEDRLDISVTTPRKPVSNTAVYGVDFDNWYQAYPRHVGRGQAIKAYIKVRVAGTSAMELLDAVVIYASVSKDTEKKYIKHPATWLNAESWLDEIDEGSRSELQVPGPLAPIDLKVAQ